MAHSSRGLVPNINVPVSSSVLDLRVQSPQNVTESVLQGNFPTVVSDAHGEELENNAVATVDTQEVNLLSNPHRDEGLSVNLGWNEGENAEVYRALTEFDRDVDIMLSSEDDHYSDATSVLNEWKKSVMESLYDYYDPSDQPCLAFVVQTINLLRENLAEMHSDIMRKEKMSGAYDRLATERDDLTLKILRVKAKNQILKDQCNEFKDIANTNQANLNYVRGVEFTLKATVLRQKAKIDKLQEQNRELISKLEKAENLTSHRDSSRRQNQKDIDNARSMYNTLKRSNDMYQEIICDVATKFAKMKELCNRDSAVESKDDTPKNKNRAVPKETSTEAYENV